MKRDELFHPGQYTSVPYRLMACRNLDWYAKGVWITIAGHLGENTGSFPGFGLIAKEAGIERARIPKIIQKLEASGWITREKRRKGSKSYTSNYYTLEIPACPCAACSPPQGSAPEAPLPPKGVVPQKHHPSAREALPPVPEKHYPQCLTSTTPSASEAPELNQRTNEPETNPVANTSEANTSSAEVLSFAHDDSQEDEPGPSQDLDPIVYETQDLPDLEPTPEPSTLDTETPDLEPEPETPDLEPEPETQDLDIETPDQKLIILDQRIERLLEITRSMKGLHPIDEVLLANPRNRKWLRQMVKLHPYLEHFWRHIINQVLDTQSSSTTHSWEWMTGKYETRGQLIYNWQRKITDIVNRDMRSEPAFRRALIPDLIQNDWHIFVSADTYEKISAWGGGLDPFQVIDASQRPIITMKRYNDPKIFTIDTRDYQIEARGGDAITAIQTGISRLCQRMNESIQTLTSVCRET